MTPTDTTTQQAQSLSLRLFVACLGAAELMTTYLGVMLGLYEALRAGPATAAELAVRAGIDPRYAREWAEQQAAAGILTVDDPAAAPARRVFTLPPGHAEALTEPDSPHYVAPLAVFPVGGIAGVLPELLDAYRSGEGVPYATYGRGLRGGQGGLNRSVFVNQLGPWIREAMPDVDHALSSGSARIADIACGSGWSSIALARAYPDATVDGYDLDPTTIIDAADNAKLACVGNRVRFHQHDAATAPDAGDGYQLLCILDALHDMARPVEVLAAARAMVADGGTVLLMEPRVADKYTAPARDVERFMFAVSLLHCLPAGMSDPPSAATGAMMRLPLVRRYAAEAGFTKVTVLPVEHTFHRLYRLTP